MAELKAAREAREAKPPEKKEKHHEKKVDIDDRQNIAEAHLAVCFRCFFRYIL